MRAITRSLFQSDDRVRTRVGAAAIVGIMMLAISTTVTAEEPEPITPSYCRLGGCLWEAHTAGRTNYHGTKKVKKNELVRIACGYSKKGEGGGIRHIDGRLLLDKKGQPIVCCRGGTIYTTAGTHTIGIGDEDFTIDFEPVKWYTFDWKNYAWEVSFADPETGDPMLTFLPKSQFLTVVFGQGPFGTVRTARDIILAQPADGHWEWFNGPYTQ